jgi:type II secretory pathway component PulF
MARYRYTAMATPGASGGAGASTNGGGVAVMAGGLARGEREAADEFALRASLRGEGLIAMEVKPVGFADGMRAVASSVSSGLGGGGGGVVRASASESAWFFQTLAMLLKHQVPLESALGTMDELAPTARERRHCAVVRDALRSGHGPAEAVSRVPGLGAPQHLALLRSAQESGRLDHAVALIERSIAAGARVRRAILSGLFYPAVLGVVSLGVLWFLATFVIPRFAETLESLGGTLPWQTKFTLNAARVLVWVVPVIAACGVAAWLSRGVWMTTTRRRALHHFLLRLPVVGSFLWNGQGAMVCETMATMLEGGSDALSALGQARSVATSPVIGDRLDKARKAAREGVELGQAFKDNSVLPPTAQAVMRIAMRAGDLGGGLRQAASLCADQQDRLTQRLLAIMGPAVIVLMAGCVGWVVWSLVSGMMALNEIGGSLSV